jgi:DNA-binding transcriptional LysR family regulator
VSLRLTLRQLEYLVAVAERGSVAQAAAALHVSAPSVSTAIAQAEAELGLRVFLRRPARGLVPTPAGLRLLDAAREALRAAERVAALASDLRETVAGPLAIGCLVTFAPLVLPELLARFAAEHPAVRLRHEEADHEALMEALRAGRLDAALTYDLGLPPGLAFEALAPVPPHVLLAPSHPLAPRPALTPDDLRGHPMVLLDLPASGAYFLSAFGPVLPPVAARTRDMAMARSLAANGAGFLLVNLRPLSDTAPDGKRLVARPLAGGPRALRLGLARAEGPRPPRAVAAWAAHCRRHVTPRAVPGARMD